MLSDSLQSGVVDATPLSTSSDQQSSECYCDEKRYAARKYQRNSLEKRQKRKLMRTLDSQYQEIVEDIQRLRLRKSDPTKHVRKLEKIKKKQKKLCKIAYAQSGLDIEGFRCALLDGLKAFIETMKEYRDEVGENVIKFFLDLFSTLYNIYSNPTWKSFLINFSSFFSRHLSLEMAELALTWLKDAFNIALSQDDSETTKVLILRLFDNAMDFLNDQLWSNICDFFAKVAVIYAATVDMVSIESLDMETLTKKFQEFRSHAPEVRSLIEMAMLAQEYVCGNWQKIRSGDWSNVLLGKDETKEFEVEVRVLEQAFSFVLSNREVDLMDRYKMTPDQYQQRLSAAIKKASTLISRCTSVQQKMCISNFIKSLTEKQSHLFASIADAPRKLEAYAVKFAGPSGTGKSTLLDLCSKIILKAYDRDPSERGQVVFTNISEKYESTIFPNHKIICADDVANNKNEKPNYDRILNYVNTVPRPLEKADTKEKGIYYPGNDAFLATTNDETLRAMQCSCAPESILRRFALDVTVNIRPQFQNEYGGLRSTNERRFDVYELTLKRFSHIEVDSETEKKTIVWKEIPRNEWNPDDDGTQDFKAMCRFLASDVKRHIATQKEKARIQKELDECKFCEECGCPTVICSCKHQDAIAMFGSLWSTCNTRELWDVRAALSGCRHSLMRVHKDVSLGIKLYQKRAQIQNLLSGGLAALIVGCVLSPRVGCGILTAIVASVLYLRWKIIKEVDEEISRRNDRLSSLCESVREQLRSNMKYFAFGASLLAIYKCYRVVRHMFVTQDKSSYFDEKSDLFKVLLKNPKGSEHRIILQDERDYKEGYSRITPKETKISKTTTSADLRTAVAKALRFVIVRSKGEVYGTVNGLMVASNVIMIPSHALPESMPFDIETSATPGVPSAKTKDQKLDERYCVINRDLDIAFVHLASSPASSEFAQFFPEEYPQFYSRATTLVWKSPDNKVTYSEQAARQLSSDLNYYGALERDGYLYGTRQTLHRYVLKKGTGLRVDLDFEGFGGLCGGMYIDSSKGLIYGFHVAGYRDSCSGYLTCVTQPIIKDALAQLDKTSPTLLVHSAGEVRVDLYGEPYTLVNEKPLYVREDGTKEKTIVTYFGQVRKNGVPLEERARAPYIPTPFKGIQQEFGPSKHKPPRHPNDVGKAMKTLNKLTQPVQHYEGDILAKAVEDYQDQTLDIIRQNREECSEMLRLYTQEEAMDGCEGVGGMPNASSAGFPINKSKKQCLVRDPMDESLVKVPREFDSAWDIQGEIDRTEKCWRDGVRSEAIYKASSKVNELLENSKANEKVRKFYGSGFANFVASKKKLAGIPRFMRRFWRQTECLVGINATSKEWREYHDYLVEYGTDRMIAGDFSGFDTRMAAQITAAAAKIMVSWYAEAGCNEDELREIRGALSDIVHPNILFSGDLYRFANANPSGNLITVQLNSICNSLMMRYVYYAMMPNIKEKFSSNIRLGTYGDDNAMSVKAHCKWYNHTSCQREFEKLDIGYTMADKGATSVPYISISQISFLKRFFVRHPELNSIVAPIEMDSILKKFHWVKKPNESPLSFDEQFGAYTDGAFREMYLHGRPAYEKFTEQIKRIIALNSSLKSQVSLIPYDEMTEILRPYYLDSYVNDNKKLFAESCGVDVSELANVDLEDEEVVG
ncbi:hypothetical protein 1 [Beihai picorna-like virus 41]|uniref:hypothetical protein 1 n=1 Tax=Beihai picorna-like virus 41 TaxID=1922585 RepID=UPI00090CC970|nr:hypothetical protein 1 [Beihai picorna-like virus 41]APG76807.1 hypothetical protein 1 [Beihai picorna-like virus 41]